MTASRAAAALGALILFLSPPAHAQTINDLAGSWTPSDADGAEEAFLTLTCNDVWDATQNGKTVAQGRGQHRIVKLNGGYFIAENGASFLTWSSPIEIKPLKVVDAGAGKVSIEIDGKTRQATLAKNSNDEIVLTFAAAAGGKPEYWVRCMPRPGKSLDEPYAATTANPRNYFGCQYVDEMIARNMATSAPALSERFKRYAATWAKALQSLDPRAADPGYSDAVAAMWSSAPNRQAFFAAEIDRCNGAAPAAPNGIRDSRKAPAAAPPTRPAR